MKIFEVIKEDAVPSTPVAQPGQTATTPDNGDPNIAKLTAGISDIQKQIKDLQKAALQQQQAGQAQPVTPPQPKPGEAGQAQAAKGTVGAGSTTTQPQVGQPMGQPPVQQTQQPATTPPTAQIQPPGVNRPPQVVNMKIKQQLAKNAGQTV
jgi:hypothetical protein